MKAPTLVLALCGLFLARPSIAGEPIKDGIAPDAYTLVKAVSDFHKALPSASADVKLTLTQEVPGHPK